VSLLGHSLGAAAALQAGAVIPARQILLIAPFTSMRAMAKRSVGVPLAYLLRHDFDNEARLGRSSDPPTRPTSRLSTAAMTRSFP